MISTEQQRRDQAAAALYERHGRPLEAEHRGEYAVIARDGRLVLAPTLAQALASGAEQLGRDTVVFKIGDIAVSGRHA